ncbi:MAG: hypothetical protein H6581_08045 [Bacteroidia bacterium]|nr:hypothetical protein [Bacteroidia bacterium]
METNPIIRVWQAWKSDFLLILLALSVTLLVIKPARNLFTQPHTRPFVCVMEVPPVEYEEYFAEEEIRAIDPVSPEPFLCGTPRIHQQNPMQASH